MEMTTITVRYFRYEYCHPVLISPPTPQVSVLQGISEQQTTPYTMHIHCCLGRTATLDLAASVDARALKSHETAALAWRQKMISMRLQSA